jgi:hypothetical protein
MRSVAALLAGLLAGALGVLAGLARLRAEAARAAEVRAQTIAAARAEATRARMARVAARGVVDIPGKAGLSPQTPALSDAPSDHPVPGAKEVPDADLVPSAATNMADRDRAVRDWLRARARH